MRTSSLLPGGWPALGDLPAIAQVLPLTPGTTCNGNGCITSSATSLTGIQVLNTVVAGLLGVSTGGLGGSYDAKNDCCVGSGGNGGQLSITTAANSSISLNGPWPPSSETGIEALSIRGQPATVDFAGPGYLAADGGNGGRVGSPSPMPASLPVRAVGPAIRAAALPRWPAVAGK